MALALAAAVAVPADELDDEQDEPFELDLPFPTLEAAAPVRSCPPPKWAWLRTASTPPRGDSGARVRTRAK